MIRLSWIGATIHRDRYGYPRVILRMPTSVAQEHRRAPTRYDWDLLLRLSAMAAQKRPNAIHKAAFAESQKTILATTRRRHSKELFYSSADEERPDFFINAALKMSGNYMDSISAAAGEPNPFEERIRGKDAYRRAAKRLRTEGAYHQGILEFSSLRNLIDKLGRATNKPKNFEAVRASLEYWQRVEAQAVVR